MDTINPRALAGALPVSSVYFICSPAGPPENAAYQHLAVCLAEGLQALGVECAANVDYWLRAPDAGYLLARQPPAAMDDYDIVVVSSGLLRHGGEMQENWFRSGRGYVIAYLDEEDITAEGWDYRLDRFDWVFKAHSTAHTRYPSNVVPAGFGLSFRMLNQLNSVPEYSERRMSIVENFRCRHELRLLVKESILPGLARVFQIDRQRDLIDSPPDGAYAHLMWQQSGRRHYPAYFDRLARSAASCAFGGKLNLNGPGGPPEHQFFARSAVGSDSNARPILHQWDSWRFWESLVAGAVTFHVDLNKWGVRLPVMPANWEHYIGIDGSDVQSAVERIVQEPAVLAEISGAGRQWAINHYSPPAVALRFLETIGRSAPW